MRTNRDGNRDQTEMETEMETEMGTCVRVQSYSNQPQPLQVIRELVLLMTRSTDRAPSEDPSHRFGRETRRGAW